MTGRAGRRPALRGFLALFVPARLLSPGATLSLGGLASLAGLLAAAPSTPARTVRRPRP